MISVLCRCFSLERADFICFTVLYVGYRQNINASSVPPPFFFYSWWILYSVSATFAHCLLTQQWSEWRSQQPVSSELKKCVCVSLKIMCLFFSFQKTLDEMNDITYCPRCKSIVISEAELSLHLGFCLSCFYSFCTQCERAWHQVKVLVNGFLKSCNLFIWQILKFCNKLISQIPHIKYSVLICLFLSHLEASFEIKLHRSPAAHDIIFWNCKSAVQGRVWEKEV